MLYCAQMETITTTTIITETYNTSVLTIGDVFVSRFLEVLSLNFQTGIRKLNNIPSLIKRVPHIVVHNPETQLAF